MLLYCGFTAVSMDQVRPRSSLRQAHEGVFALDVPKLQNSAARPGLHSELRDRQGLKAEYHDLRQIHVVIV